ncbi:MAG: hypothetical protein ACK559_36665, partial [bacterium]
MQRSRQIAHPERLGDVGLDPLPGPGNQNPAVHRVCGIGAAVRAQTTPVEELIGQGRNGKARIGLGSEKDTHQITSRMDDGQIFETRVEVAPRGRKPTWEIAKDCGRKQDRETLQMQAGVSDEIVPG